MRTKRKTKAGFVDRMNALFLCIKYPFLYPRNRFTDKHYNNWDLNEKLKVLYSKAYVSRRTDDGFETKMISLANAIVYHVLLFWYNHPMQWMHFVPEFTELDSMEPAWRNAFGDDLVRELKKAMIEDGGRRYLRKVRIMQIKEKWGGLEIYLNFYGSKTFDVIRKYSGISRKICIECGKDACGRTTLRSGWICPYCKDHYERMKESDKMKRLEENGIEWFEFFDGKEKD